MSILPSLGGRRNGPGRVRAWRRLGGVAGAAAFHLAFFYLIVFKRVEPPPVEPVESLAPVSVSLYPGRAPAPSPAPPVSPQSPDLETSAAAAPIQPSLVSLPSPTPDRPPQTPKPAIEPQAVLPPAESLVPQLDLRSEPTPLHSPAAAPQQLAGASPTGGERCELTTMLQQALQQNAAVRQAIARLPRQSRSVANAVMVWNGAWAQPPVADAAVPITVIEAELRAIVRTAPASCNDQPVLGPQFIVIPDPDGTTVLVIGSGQWTWGSLLR